MASLTCPDSASTVARVPRVAKVSWWSGPSTRISSSRRPLTQQSRHRAARLIEPVCEFEATPKSVVVIGPKVPSQIALARSRSGRALSSWPASRRADTVPRRILTVLSGATPRSAANVVTARTCGKSCETKDPDWCQPAGRLEDREPPTRYRPRGDRCCQMQTHERLDKSMDGDRLLGAVKQRVVLEFGSPRSTSRGSRSAKRGTFATTSASKRCPGCRRRPGRPAPEHDRSAVVVVSARHMVERLLEDEATVESTLARSSPWRRSGSWSSISR